MGARRSFREGIRVFCCEARGLMYLAGGCGGRLRAESSYSSHTSFGSHYRDRMQRRPQLNGTIISSEPLCGKRNEGIRGSRAVRLEFWGSPADADRCRNTLSPCALGSEEASHA